MPRKREGVIVESLDELRALLEAYKGKPEHVRLLALVLLREQPHFQFDDVAQRIGFSSATIKRWWRVYREGGVTALLQRPGHTKGNESSGRSGELQGLRDEITRGIIRTFDDLQQWMMGQVSIRLARDASRSVPIVPAVPTGEVHPSNGKHMDDGSGSGSQVPTEHLVRFLQTLSISNAIPEWSESFRIALRTLFSDVDHSSLTINVLCDLVNPIATDRAGIAVIQSVGSPNKSVEIVPAGSSSNEDDRHLDRMMASLKSRSFPFNKYHPPHGFVYYYGERVYMAMIVLWRERHRPPISQRTLSYMAELRVFWGFVFSQFIARHQNARPVERVFDSALLIMTRDSGLTVQERRILILLMMGMSYEDVAGSLNISLNTVRYHLRSIYSKTDTHSQAELFAKYFTPRFDPNHPSQ